jgi:hypothetical protein
VRPRGLACGFDVDPVNCDDGRGFFLPRN